MRNRIAKARRNKNWTLRQLSQKVDIAMSTLSQYETGKREPRLSMWIKLSETLGVSVPYLQGLNETDIIKATEDYELGIKQAVNDSINQFVEASPLLRNDLLNMVNATFNISDMSDKARIPFSVWSKMFLKLTKDGGLTASKLQEFNNLTTELIQLISNEKTESN